MDNSEFTLENRRLCSDGSCIGTIGDDDLCKECGKPYEGDLPGGSVFPSTTDEDNMDEDNKDEEIRSDDTLSDSDERVCCLDDTCIGIIGPNGTCGTCGR